MAVVAGVHGIAQQQFGRHQLREPWARALADGLERSIARPVAVPHVDVAFYGDEFLPDAEGRKAISAPDWLAGVTAEELEDLHAAVEDVAPGETVPSETVPSEAEPGDPEKGMPPLPGAVLALARVLDARFPASDGVLSLGELRQVRRYLRDPGLKARVDARVREAVGEDCRVLIGHSLGSVVAVEFARKNPEQELDLLLTLGSPLGLRMVRSRLTAAGSRPPNVARWVNIRDPRDAVACAGDLRSWWPDVVDAVVDNERDPHSVTRYLAKRQSGDAVASAAPELVT